ncbi:hypothetical protein D5086_031792 [Populus alba]|uniref:Uncharacterized protein n=1 Tax=Populus alba TaxID=43335 RepID=A0ACC4AKH2_POPAL
MPEPRSLFTPLKILDHVLPIRYMVALLDEGVKTKPLIFPRSFWRDAQNWSTFSFSLQGEAVFPLRSFTLGKHAQDLPTKYLSNQAAS